MFCSSLSCYVKRFSVTFCFLITRFITVLFPEPHVPDPDHGFKLYYIMRTRMRSATDSSLHLIILYLIKSLYNPLFFRKLIMLIKKRSVCVVRLDVNSMVILISVSPVLTFWKSLVMH